MDTRERYKKLIKQMEKSGIDAALVSSFGNLRYYSGFTSSDGMLLVLPSARYLVTDFRYIEQGKRQCVDCEIIEASDLKAIEFIKNKCEEAGVSSLWFEEEYVTYRFYKQLEDGLEGVNLVPAKGAVSRGRMIKSAKELEYIRKAAAMADEGFLYMLEFIKPGMSERDIALELEFFLRRKGSEDVAFDIIVASGENAALPHAQPTDRILRQGDVLILDFGCVIQGYRSDMTRTVFIGEPDSKLKEIYDIVLGAQLRALDGLGPGMTGREVDALARDYISEKGYGEYFGHGLGHGVGLDIHEEPRLSPRGSQTLETGMVVTVEPGIYLPGEGGVRIEDLVVITDEGIENLTTSPKQLYIL